MGKELDRIGAPFRQPEWSALALIEDPASVVCAHLNFIEAGAELITVNAYAVVPFHLGAARFRERGAELADLAGKLAREAVNTSGRSVKVAGSIPPLFGSYEPALFDADAAPGLFDELIRAQAPYVDLWIGETIGSCAEAEAIGAALDRVADDMPRWFAFSLDVDLADGRGVLWSGESIESAVRAALGQGADAILLNCAPPEIVDIGLAELVATLDATGTEIDFGAYANAFPPRPDEYAANSVVLGRRDDLTGSAYADAVQGWIDLGATIVGGCCGIHPEQIEAVRDRLTGTEPTD